MSEERTRVLRMLADAKITAEQANQLLEALDASEVAIQEMHTSFTQPEQTTGEDDAANDRETSGTGGAPHAMDELSLDQLVAMKSVGVTLEYIQAVRDLGYHEVDADQLIAMKSVGVTPEFVETMRDLEVAGLTPDQLIALKGVGVTPEFVQQMRATGYSELSAGQLVSLKCAGVDPEFVLGMSNQTRN
jgi:hypothetical protein